MVKVHRRSEVTGKTLVEDLKDLLTEGIVGTQEELCSKLRIN